LAFRRALADDPESIDLDFAGRRFVDQDEIAADQIFGLTHQRLFAATGTLPG
jgi:hypothetical protein